MTTIETFLAFAVERGLKPFYVAECFPDDPAARAVVNAAISSGDIPQKAFAGLQILPDGSGRYYWLGTPKRSKVVCSYCGKLMTLSLGVRHCHDCNYSVAVNDDPLPAVAEPVEKYVEWWESKQEREARIEGRR